MTENVENLILKELLSIRRIVEEHTERFDTLESTMNTRIDTLESTMNANFVDISQVFNDFANKFDEHNARTSHLEKVLNVV